MSKPDGERYTIAVDFDGVIHSYTTPLVDAETIPDPPVEGAIAWLLEMSKHFDVVIFSTRCKTEAGRESVKRWIHDHGPLLNRTFADCPLCRMRYEAEKPAALIYIDDRAYRFEGPGTFPTREQIHQAKPWNKR